MRALTILQCLPIFVSVTFTQPTLADEAEIYREGNPIVLDSARRHLAVSSNPENVERQFLLHIPPPYPAELDTSDRDVFIDDEANSGGLDKRRLRFIKRQLLDDDTGDEDVDKRRLRFNKRRLRFNKRRLRFNKRRLRFVKKDAGEDSSAFQGYALEVPREQRRLRFVKKDLGEDSAAFAGSAIEAPREQRRLRFVKKDLGDDSMALEAPREQRRLRFVKKEVGDDSVDFEAPREQRRLRYVKKDLGEDSAAFEGSDIEAPREVRRLRFVKKDVGADGVSFEGAEIEAPREQRRLRFVAKRAAESGTAAAADEMLGDHQAAHSRRRRSVDDDMEGEARHDLSKRVDLSINNALRLLTDMLIVKLQKKRQRELAELRQRLLNAGKRSVDDVDNAATAAAAVAAANDNPDDSELVKRLTSLFV